MLRIGRAARALALACSVFGLTSARSDEEPTPHPQAVDPVDRVLADWQAKASTISKVDVRFRRTDVSGAWGSTRYNGRAILAAPNLALLETHSVGQDNKATSLNERTIWNGRSILQFDEDQHKVFRFSIRDEWPEAPGLLRLPFFFRMTVEEAKRDYQWALIRETLDEVILAASPKTKSVTGAKLSRYFIFLDRKTYLPKRLTLYEADGGTRRTFDRIEIKINAVEDLDSQMKPSLDSWTILEGGEWVTRLFLK